MKVRAKWKKGKKRKENRERPRKKKPIKGETTSTIPGFASAGI